VRQNTALPSQQDAFFKASVFAYTDLASEDDVLLDGNTTGESSLCGDYNVLADLAIVSDVYQVVDFCAAADARDVESSAIDGGVGSDFDIVFNFEASDLREFFVMAGCWIADVAKAVAAKHGAGMDDDAISQLHARIKRGAGIQIAIASNDYAGTNHTARSYPRAFPDVDVFTDHDSLVDGHTVGQLHLMVYDSAGVNARRTLYPGT
jgi:hypothetical protein